MTKKFLYFQPEYVREFVCNASKCNDNCCERNWRINIDTKTFEQYRQIKPESKSREITARFDYDAENNEYLLKARPCPFLNDKKLCRLQLEHGENFLSITCATYPRRTLNFGRFFERSLILSCPLVAEKVLLNKEPMKFEFVEVSEYEHSHNGKLTISAVYAGEKFAAHMLEVQIAMISILQERTLTIDQRLIVLGFFLDKLDEIIFGELGDDALTKLIAAYESKKFLAEQVPRMLSTVHFNPKKFSALMIDIIDKLDDEKFSAARELLTSRKNFADELKLFRARQSTFMENYLVNELFMTCVPYKFRDGIAKNFGLFVAQYKILELLALSATRQNFDAKALLKVAIELTKQADHDETLAKIILELVPEDIFDSLETFLEP